MGYKENFSENKDTDLSVLAKNTSFQIQTS